GHGPGRDGAGIDLLLQLAAGLIDHHHALIARRTAVDGGRAIGSLDPSGQQYTQARQHPPAVHLPPPSVCSGRSPCWLLRLTCPPSRPAAPPPWPAGLSPAAPPPVGAGLAVDVPSGSTPKALGKRLPLLMPAKSSSETSVGASPASRAR